MEEEEILGRRPRDFLISLSLQTDDRFQRTKIEERIEGFRGDVRKRCTLSSTKLDRIVVPAKTRGGVETDVVVEDDSAIRMSFLRGYLMSNVIEGSMNSARDRAPILSTRRIT